MKPQKERPVRCQRFSGLNALIDMELERLVRARDPEAMLVAIARCADRAVVMPPWLAAAVLSPWGERTLCDLFATARRHPRAS